jgi:hypothetical protein
LTNNPQDSLFVKKLAIFRLLYSTVIVTTTTHIMAGAVTRVGKIKRADSAKHVGPF